MCVCVCLWACLGGCVLVCGSLYAQKLFFDALYIHVSRTVFLLNIITILPGITFLFFFFG